MTDAGSTVTPPAGLTGDVHVTDLLEIHEATRRIPFDLILVRGIPLVHPDMPRPSPLISCRAPRSLSLVLTPEGEAEDIVTLETCSKNSSIR